MAKLILTHQVSGLGSAGDVVEVKNGYARNYLLPRGYAVTWSKGGEKQVELIRAARKTREIANREEAESLRDSLQAKALKIAVKTGQGGKLFGAVKPDHVAQAVEIAGLGSVDKKRVEILKPIKAVGIHQATIRLHDEVIANVELDVVAD